MVRSVVAIPWREYGPKLEQTPVRGHSRPVSSAALDGVHTEKPAWKSVNRMPEAASASMCGVSDVTSCQLPTGKLGIWLAGTLAAFAPKSPQPARN